MRYKLVIHPDIEVENTSIRFLFETKKELLAASDTSAELLLFMQDKAKIMDDCSNSFEMFEKAGRDWEIIENS